MDWLAYPEGTRLEKPPYQNSASWCKLVRRYTQRYGPMSPSLKLRSEPIFRRICSESSEQTGAHILTNLQANFWRRAFFHRPFPEYANITNPIISQI